MQKAQGPGVCKLPKPPASRALCQAKRAPRAAFPSGCLAAQTKRWAEGSIEKKIGKDNYAKIADDAGILITENKAVLTELSKKGEEIEQLKSDKEALVIANGNLLQQIPMSNEDAFEPKPKEEPEKKSISLKDAFDAKGNFIH